MCHVSGCVVAFRKLRCWRRGGLDVEAAGRHEEVQKGSRSVVDWTLKKREGTRKSKKEAVAWWIGC